MAPIPPRPGSVVAAPTRRAVTTAIAASLAAGCGGGAGGRQSVPAPPAPSPPPPPPAPPGLFPLRLQVGLRHPLKANGEAFLLHGDTAWSLISDASREAAVEYLNDRQSRRFNAVVVNLIEHKFASHAPANFYNDEPFTTAGDFSTPNEAYFAHADYVIGQARQRGILVALAPAYLGYDGGDEGWYREMLADGTASLANYGRYLGSRYAGFDNILWVEGGDFTPPNKALTRAVAEGVKAIQPSALQTAHCSRDTAALDFWRGEGWLNINTTYTSDRVADKSLAQYRRPEAMPFFLVEARYERSELGSPLTLRKQVYNTLLNGGFGHMFGNADVWHFDGPGVVPATTDWRRALDSPGTQLMEIFWELFSALRWDLLVPDLSGRFLTAGQRGDDARAGAALAQTGAFGMIYAPTPRTMSVDLAQLRGRSVRARWFDPSNGRYAAIAGSPFARAVTNFAPPGANSAGDDDWVLLLESA